MKSTKETTSAVELKQYLHKEMRDIYSEEEFQELQGAAEFCDRISEAHCEAKHMGGMEEWAKENKKLDLSCDWYHSTWCYMRLLNMVAVPRWYPFYLEAISKVLKRKKNARVMISACADYGMLHTLHCAAVAAGATPDIVIYDICETPLLSAKWYADRHGFEVNCILGNIITSDIPRKSFDLIVTDEFLTVLKNPNTPLIVERWKEYLKPEGVLVTTAMVGGETTEALRKKYYNRAVERYNEFGHLLYPEIRSSPEKGRRLLAMMEKFATVHNRFMLSGEADLKVLFKDWKSMEAVPVSTPGECVNPTQSFQIVASFGG
jgi:2-polyprenyl-3-methyl-5-hydroxy-6-metoxy-1,4-benzoquinol methylase